EMAAGASNIRELITKYSATAADVVAQFRQDCGQDDLLRAWRSRVLTQDGTMPSGLKFCFHGCGCYFERGFLKIDVDFGPDGRCDGFDAWRLSLFAKENSLGRDWTFESVQAALNQLESARLIVRPEWLPSPHLYYRTEAFSVA